MPYGECECRMKVHLRMRPSSKPSSALHFDEAKAMVRIDVQKKQSNSGGPTKLYTDQIVFSLDSVIRTTDQETVFDLCAKEIVDDVLRGYNGTIMTYGHVGSGKTFTMTGGIKEYACRGIIPRAVHRLFQEKEEKPEAGITVQMSYLEVYNEVYDKWSCTLTPICTENIQKQTSITKSSWSLTGIVCTTISEVTPNL